MAVRKSDDGLVKVTPVHPYQVSHDGKVAGPGESLKVPEAVARQWERSGLVTVTKVVTK